MSTKPTTSPESLALAIVKAEPRIDSRLLAKSLRNQHKATIALIERYADKFKAMGLLPFKKEVITGKGQPEKFALLNEDQAFFLLSLSRNSAHVVSLKARLVLAFRDARRAAAVRQDEYLLAHHALHDAIRDKAAGSHNERFMHINANKALNQLAGVRPGCRASAGTLKQSLLAVGSAMAAKAVLGARDGHGLQQHIKNALKPLEGILALGETLEK
jgi:phage regulator Rha-like protein